MNKRRFMPVQSADDPSSGALSGPGLYIGKRRLDQAQLEALTRIRHRGRHLVFQIDR